MCIRDSKDIDPEELAMKLGISYSWFRKVFKEYTGYAPAKYYQELKLDVYKRQLQSVTAGIQLLPPTDIGLGSCFLRTDIGVELFIHTLAINTQVGAAVSYTHLRQLYLVSLSVG